MNSARRVMLTRQLCKYEKLVPSMILTDGFPYTFYKEVVSKVILYRDTHIEVRLQNGQIV